MALESIHFLEYDINIDVKLDGGEKDARE